MKGCDIKGLSYFLLSSKIPILTQNIIIFQSNRVPYFVVGDDAFPLTRYLLKPYSETGRKELTPTQMIYNYRVTRLEHCAL